MYPFEADVANKHRSTVEYQGSTPKIKDLSILFFQIKFECNVLRDDGQNGIDSVLKKSYVQLYSKTLLLMNLSAILSP